MERLWFLALAVVVAVMLVWVAISTWRARASQVRFDHSVDEPPPDQRDQHPPAA
ncbi:hypothetical protein [Nocardioides guangzhouensis]|uniref:hypothetical protein n=1 Tax=Nocardioides guangzhouensis TaxID=2497878 RepID=UPI0014383DB5|nr:hypothetical protein [Nocardioides guangzhouensis]